MQTVKVRIAVAVDCKGEWHACGWKGLSDGEAHSYCIDHLDPGEARYFITADLPIPEAVEVAGVVER